MHMPLLSLAYNIQLWLLLLWLLWNLKPPYSRIVRSDSLSDKWPSQEAKMGFWWILWFPFSTVWSAFPSHALVHWSVDSVDPLSTAPRYFSPWTSSRHCWLPRSSLTISVKHQWKSGSGTMLLLTVFWCYERFGGCWSCFSIAMKFGAQFHCADQTSMIFGRTRVLHTKGNLCATLHHWIDRDVELLCLPAT